MSLTIALVTGEFPPMEGGVGDFTYELAQALADRGHELHVITSREARPTSAARDWRQLRKPVRMEFGWLHPVARGWRWGDIGRIADLSKRHEFDVINIQYQAAAYNMRHPGINLGPRRLRALATTVVTFHDLRVPYLLPKLGRIRRWAVHEMASGAHGVVVTNSEDSETLRSRIDTPVAQIPIGSNIAVHQTGEDDVKEIREKLGLGDGDRLVGFFGFLHPSKGADLLVDALAASRAHIHLVFIGGNLGASDNATTRGAREEIQRSIASHKLSERVHWSGYVEPGAVSAFLSAVDLMVMPYRDGVSLRRGTLMAILAHGCPLLTTEAPASNNELQHGVHCWMVPASDVPALSGGMERMLADPELRRNLGQRAALLSKQFEWDEIARRTEAFYLQLRKCG